ncbi:HD-GYP domain-containing protein [Candidatus Omnitrophota bacterium]
MPRIFDILRGKEDEGGEKKKEEQKPAVKEELKEAAAQQLPDKKPDTSFALRFPRKVLEKNERDKEEKDHSLDSKRLISTVKTHGVDNTGKAKELYNSTLETVNTLLEKVRLEEDLNPFMGEIRTILDGAFNQLVMGDSVLDNIYEEREDVYYLPYHIVNTLLISMAIGMKMGFNKSRMDTLGMAAIFFDVGLDELKNIITQPRKLTEEERCWVEAHISKTIKILKKIKSVNEDVIDAVRMHHERVNGKGYPRGIQGDSISNYAKIIGLVDTYEAITNSRPYVEGMNAHKAVKFILGSLKDYFDPDVLKVFIDKMSVYPLGSIVKLDTNEIARVIGVHPGSPLRPVIMIIRDASGEPVTERSTIDLFKQDFPSIVESL